MTRGVEGRADSDSPSPADRPLLALVEELPQRALRLSGRDALSFVQRVMSNDIERVEPGSGQLIALLTAKARVLSLMVMLRCGQDLLALVEAEVAEATCEAIDRYIIADDVELEWLDVVVSGLYGSGVGDIQALASVAQLEPFAHREVELAGSRCRIVRDDLLGVPGVAIVAPRDSAAAMHQHLRELGAATATEADYETWRVEAGTPRMGRELDEQVLILEAGQLGAVSFDKGCYIGQEPVCRVHSRGQVNRRLVGLRLSGDRLPACGEQLAHPDKPDAGRVTSAVRSPAAGGVIALGYLHRKVAEPGTSLRLAEGGEAIVVELPHVSFGQRRSPTLPRYER